ncbi:hypothetical protein BLNAU_22219 [Blattamonas nauphoetae]|uniref:IPT/TIG domain-containing protein n=1 Tax=Blattamonas nauphoetae TaxID=2049346 RepID=A0ABQ9WU66_9EUKA|nr:hypothetical protein BLNAU_22219 [Blattamonas nauphoetae]
MFFLFALLSASSFRIPNAGPVVTITPGTIGTDGKGKITVKGTDFPESGSSNAYADVDVELVYTSATSNAVVTLSETGVTVTAGAFTHEFEITVDATGTPPAFKDGLKYALTSASVSGATYTPAETDAVTFTVPPKTLALVYTEATATTYTVAATFSEEHAAAVVVVFTPKATDGTAVEVSLPFATASATSTATLTIGAEGSASVFKIGEEYTVTLKTLTGYTITPAKWTPANPLTTVYASKLTPVDEEKKDGAKDKVSMTCTNGMIKAALVEGDTKTQTLVVKEGESDAITLTQTADKINFTITAGQCVVDYLYNDAKIAKGKTGTAKLTLGTTEFLEGSLTFDGSKSVASIIAALLAVLAIVF